VTLLLMVMRNKVGPLPGTLLLLMAVDLGDND
jgi:hypothetical protein